MSSSFRSQRPVQTAALVAVLLTFFSGVPRNAQAQPQLTFTRIVNNWPMIELYFTASCNNQPAYFTDERFFTVRENGIAVGDFALWCPDPEMDCCISVTMVFDASGSMMGSSNAGAKAAGNAFVDMMDGVCDEAAVLWFNAVVNIQQGMTTSLDLLHQAVNALPASGNSALWDAIYQGILELLTNGVNQCRAVVVLTDGGDNSSSHTITDVVSLANRNRVRVVTVGLGSDIDGAQLQSIADLTGGRYYEAPSASRLVAIFQEISTLIFQGFRKCLITYTGQCMDGSTRTVDLTLSNFCGGAVTKTRSYTAPFDSSTSKPLRIGLARVRAHGDALVTVPLRVQDTIASQTAFPPVTFTVLYDTSCVRFLGLATPPGSLLEGLPMSVTPRAGEVTVVTHAGRMFGACQPPATLAELLFTARSPAGRNTVCCPLKLSSWTFSAGCLEPVLTDGEILFIPPRTAVACALSAPAITVDYVTWEYNPMPFTVNLSATNSGGWGTDSVYATIIVPKDLQLYGPDAPAKNTKPLQPAILDSGRQGGVSWTLWHPITLDTKTYKVGVWVKTSNADSSYCEVEVVIPSRDAPVLSPRCATPDSLRFDTVTGSYDPNPFQMKLICVNRGGLPASNVTGFIYLPANVELADPLDSLRKTFNPSTMDEYKGGAVPELTWNLRYTKILRYQTYLDIRFVVGGMGPTGIPTDSVEAWCRVRVPGVMPSVSCWFRLPDSLALNAEGTDVEPNPFPVVFKVWNTSWQTVAIRTVDLNYPFGDDLYLDPSTPKTINPNKTLMPGDTLMTTWIMTAKNRITRRDVTIFAVAYDDEGNPIICMDRMPIANLLTSMSCSATASHPVIAYDSVSREYAPNTWTITATLVNTGGAALSDVTAEIELEDSTLVQYVTFGPDTAFDNTNPRVWPALFPQASTAFTWHFKLAAPNMTGVSIYPIFNIKYTSCETPLITSGCHVPLEIRPAIVSGIDHPPLAGLQPEIFPDPSVDVITVRIPSRAGETVHITIVDMLGREVMDRRGEASSRLYQSALRIEPAVPGTYFLLIRSGDRRWVRSVRVY
jgi:hypothetical protein